MGVPNTIVFPIRSIQQFPSEQELTVKKSSRSTFWIFPIGSAVIIAGITMTGIEIGLSSEDRTMI